MEAMLSSHTNRLAYLLLIFLFIFGDIVGTNYIFRSVTDQSDAIQFFSFLSLLILQVVASPLQAALSDLYCRKKSLVFSLSMSLISLILLYLYIETGKASIFLLSLIIAIKGLLGNTLPLSFAAIADIRNKKIRLSFGIATSPYTAGYFYLIFTNKIFSETSSTFLSIVGFILIAGFCLLFFYDMRDKTTHENQVLHLNSSVTREVKKEVKSIFASICDFPSQMAFISYLLWEISLYSILLIYVDFEVKTFSSIGIAMLSGALTAVFVLKFFERADDEKMIKWGYNLSALSLIPFFVLYPFLDNFNFYLLSTCYYFHTMGNILLSAALFALMAKRTPPHQCGKIYGLLDSVDTIAFLIASIFIMLYNYFELKLIYLILLSYLAVTFSWIPYAKFKKTRSAGN